ncbi:IS4 family transposase [Bacteroidia bacterium]|nr:IS4 family transposase [Bacteroidia bacterium]GHT70871.1 IS4 family transposase [Bacteroidia bacterium]GHU88032.1 IS4 family transposase [Bacteroidia bacterium]GHV19786.1 IS4 family transposase [Bacteroidia bacterium]GHV60536.1 IS4 family transposase [Bacteroidia bacterium]
MNREKYVFAQLVSFLNEDKFRRIVNKYQGNRYVKHFTCWNQLLALMFGQLSNRESLRDLSIALAAHHSKCYHLGMGKNVSKSSLARANQDRNYRIFEEYAYFLVNEAQQKRKTDIFKLGGNIYAFDSTTIDLCLAVFWWAKFRKKKGGIKIHTLYDVETQIPTFFHITEASVHDSKAMKEIPYESGSYYIFDRAYNNFKMLYKIHQIDAYFVVRAKKNLQYKSIKWKRKLPKNVLSDTIIELTGFYPKQYYPEQLRMVKYWDEEQEREFVFITNAAHIAALQVAELYKNRWQVELFFKWLKQHLKIKRFWGTTENAVRIQIYAAICTYCLVAIVQHDMQLDRSTYEVLQILSISLMDKTHLKDLFNKTNFQYDKERCDSNEPSLFDFL